MTAYPKAATTVTHGSRWAIAAVAALIGSHMRCALLSRYFTFFLSFHLLTVLSVHLRAEIMYDEIAAAGAAGQLFVVAAGNAGQDLNVNPSYPAAYDLPNLISVASSATNDQISGFSNRGNATVDIAAPGEAILATYNNLQYGLMWGTSMATPVSWHEG